MQMRSSASDASLPDAAEALLHVLRRRRVRRHYNPDRLAEWQIEALIEAGYRAPSGGNRRPVKFVVVDSQRQVRRVMAASPGIIGNPSALIILCIDWSKAPISGSTIRGPPTPLTSISARLCKIYFSPLRCWSSEWGLYCHFTGPRSADCSICLMSGHRSSS